MEWSWSGNWWQLRPADILCVRVNVDKYQVLFKLARLPSMLLQDSVGLTPVFLTGQDISANVTVSDAENIYLYVNAAL